MPACTAPIYILYDMRTCISPSLKIRGHCTYVIAALSPRSFTAAVNLLRRLKKAKIPVLTLIVLSCAVS